MYTLANIIYPTPSLCSENHLYYRDEKDFVWHEDGVLHLTKKSFVKFDTYFNSFSIGKWKQYTTIEDIYLLLETTGELLCTIFHVDMQHRWHTVETRHISPDTNQCSIKLPSDIQDGIVYFECKAISDATIQKAYWATDTKPSHTVKLGLSITTFNRQDAVTKSTQRILKFLHESDINAHLIVVDNGKNVQLPKDQELTLIPNENFGGSGGFARGLYHLKEENNNFTHCIFMDDDASCETESIYRTYRLFEYAKNDKLAVAGSMLFSKEPNIQWENGANFNQHCMPIGSGMNMYDIHHIVDNERERTFDYGGWWYFAFPIKNAEYPYPFFVRGDDVNFGLQGQFEQITMNGIATWGDDFFHKESPLTQYLDTRSHLLHHIQVKKLDSNFTSLTKVFLRFILRYSLVCKYSSAEAQIEAMKDVLKGPKFFEDNINMQEIFKKIKPLADEEKMKPLDLDEYKDFEISTSIREGNTIKLIKIVTLNGHLIPKIFFKRRGVVLAKTDHRFGAYFMRKEVLVYHKPTKEGFLLKHDKKRFFSIFFESLKLSFRLYSNKDALIEAYKNKYDYLTSKEYWEKQFFKEKYA